MKIGTWILTILLAATAWAQSPAARPSTPTAGAQGTSKPQAAPAPQATAKTQTATQQSATKPNASAPAKSAAAAPKSTAPAATSKAAAKPEAPKSATKSAKKSATRPAAQSAKQPAKQASGKQEPGKADKDAKAAPNKAEAKAVTVHTGKRDPFVSPIKERKVAVCAATGKRCLFIEDLNLIGIVESSNGIVAVVGNGRHTYFLREHDPLADGEVLRITSEAITLLQRTSDLWGKPVEREVTRKLGMPAV